MGSAGQGGEQQALELSYFPEVLVCEAAQCGRGRVCFQSS